MPETYQYQLIIHIKNYPLQFLSADQFAGYVEKERKQGDWKKFDHWDLLKVVDDMEGTEQTFKTLDDLPKTTLFSSTGRPLITINNGG